jgi:tetratricopeptide (TPR) repeat protein
MWLRLGLRAVRAGDYAEARRYFQWAHEARPDNVVALLWLAGLTDDRDAALALLNQVLELDPDNERARAGICALCRPEEGPPAAGAAVVEPASPAEGPEVPIYRKVGQDAAPAVARPEQWSRWLLAMLLAAVALVIVVWLAFGQLRNSVMPLLAPEALPAITEMPAPAITAVVPASPSAGGKTTHTAAPPATALTAPSTAPSRTATPHANPDEAPTPEVPSATTTSGA